MHASKTATGSKRGNLAASGHHGHTSSLVSGAAQGVSLPNLARDVAALNLEKLGWSGIEAKYYELQGLLSAPTAGLNASQARQQQKQYVSAAIMTLLDKAQTECRRLLIVGDARGAVEGGLQTLRLKQDYYGDGSLPLVPAYFHLARTNQFLDKFKAAEEFLSLAQWTILQHPEAEVSLKAELHQTFGLLYASDARLDAALKQLTCATYYLSVMNGPEHVITSFGYFDLGNVFAAKSNMESAMSFYDKVKDIWHGHLSHALRLRLQQGNRTDGADDSSSNAIGNAGGTSSSSSSSVLHMGTPQEMGDENVTDAAKMLRGILALQQERFTVLHPSTTRASYVLGMFLLWVGDRAGALDAMLRTVEACRRLYGDRHPTTIEVRQLITAFGMAIPEDTSGFIEDAPTTQTSTAAAAVGSGSSDHQAQSAAVPAQSAAAASTPTEADDQGAAQLPVAQKAVAPASHKVDPPEVESVPAASPAEATTAETRADSQISAAADQTAPSNTTDEADAESKAPPPASADSASEGQVDVPSSNAAAA